MARERKSNLLQTTALVNEAYLRLVDVNRMEWQDRTHFFAMAATMMHRILVEFARAHKYQKRGGGMQKVTFDDALDISPEAPTDLVKLDDALNALAEFDPRKAKVVELRFFGGLDLDETAEVLKVSRDTVKRDWRLAKVWLLSELKKAKEKGRRSLSPPNNRFAP